MKGKAMKTRLSVLALSSALLALGLAYLPASAQKSAPQISDKCPAYVTAQVTGPQAIQYSWGVEITDADGPSRKFTWNELANFGKSANGDTAQAAEAARAEAETKGPQAVGYSWGVQIVDPDGPQVSYTWGMIDALRQPRSASMGVQPSPDSYLFKPDNCD